LKEFVDLNYSIEELDKTLTMLGIEVEGIIDYKDKYKNFVTAEVLSAEKHPKADKLTICEVDYGQGLCNVICGAANVAKGQKVVLGLPGALVTSAGFVIERRKIRDVESNGMICSQAELEIGEDSSGIWVLGEETQVGIALTDYLHLDDIILDVSLTPNKADCNSHLGVAREIAAVLNKKINFPSQIFKENDNSIDKNFEVIIKDAEKCPRYTARIIRNVKVKESPEWLKQRLMLIGLRPINVVVDVTNYVLMEQGQPLHAFDLAKIEGNKIICKTAEEGEKFVTLDGKERVLDSSMLMICDAVKSIAIGGVMGGQNSEINNETTDVLLESAFFAPSSIRKTAKKLGIQSDASYRFERGVDIDNVVNALNRAAGLIAELTGGMIDKGYIDVYPKIFEKMKILLRFERVNNIIGISIQANEIQDMLMRLGFKILSADKDSCMVEVPARRVDVGLEIDLIEEVARLYNYDNIEPDYSISVSLAGENMHKDLAIPPLRKEISDYLVKRGFNEIITQNMIDPKTAERFDNELVRISNPLGEELSVMRPTLVASMLRTIERNIRMGNRDLRLFEIGKSYHKVEGGRFIRGIEEKESLVVGMVGRRYPSQWGRDEELCDFYDIKGVAEEVFDFLGYEGLDFSKNEQDNLIFGKNFVGISKKGNVLGYLGEVSNDNLKYFDIGTKVYLLILDLSKFYNLKRCEKKYSKVSAYPSVTRDLAFIMNSNIEHEAIEQLILLNGTDLLKSLNLFDVYEGKSIEKGKKSMAYSLTFSSIERTLKDEEIDSIIKKIIESVEKKFNATLRQQ
jgi:phenylalanyl-tRNA synthetase beta chain